MRLVRSMKTENNTELKNYTTLHIGGPAKTMVHPETVEEMKQVLKETMEKNERIYVLGNGSNVLFADEGFLGTVIHIPSSFNHMERLDDNRVRVESGATNEEFANWLCSQGLSGYEFASGVPGTIGGAVYMNAGCYGGEIKDVLVEAEYLDRDGNLHTLKNEDLDLGYRHSWFTDHFGLITSAVFQLEEKDPKEIQEVMDDLHEKRWSKQPMDKHSCGSTFKRPEGYFAAALIDQAGLRGYRVGQAMVSEKHTGFLINEDKASAEEFLKLIAEVQKRVKEHSGVDLECEVRLIPYQE